MTKRAIFVGRWCPFHKGHISIMMEKIKKNIPLLIFVRDTHYDLYPAQLRKKMIEASMAKLKVDAKVEIIDDIESVNYGRGVGYEVNEIEVSDDIKEISATKIRGLIDQGDDSWKDLMAEGADKVLEDYLKQKGVVVWFTGLPCSGKTTIANEVADQLRAKNIKVEKLDGDILRDSLCKDLGFSKDDRDENLRRSTFVAKMLARNGVVVLASFITPYESVRKTIREELEKEASFIQVYTKASVEECKKRDVKGMYAKAAKGEIKNFTGVDDPFEEPTAAEVVLDTEKNGPKECAKEIISHLEELRP